MTEEINEDLEKLVLGIMEKNNKASVKPKATANTTKPPKRPRFKRGTNVLCLLVTPGESKPELLTLRKTEDMIIDRDQDRCFTVSEGPALEVVNKNKTLDCYILDSHKGCTVNGSFLSDAKMLEMKTNPETTYDLIDAHLISQFVDLKPDWKQSAGMAFFAGVLSFMFGLMF